MNKLINSVQIETELPIPGEMEPLTDQERIDIEHEISHYPHKQAATIEALKVVQKYQGWVSDGKVKAIADILEVSAEDVDGVATFYNKIYRLPVGETVISVCDSVSCWIMGYPKLIRHACKSLGIQPGQTTTDGRFTLLPTPCLGACDKAPALMNGETLEVYVTHERFDTIIK
ncbi:MAG: NADH-quinone oxidoreductase subunit E [Flavobacteriales bacterium]|jgi:NADH-quinone oxidoreductase subunit E